MNTKSFQDLIWCPIDVPPLPDLSTLIANQQHLKEWLTWQFCRLTIAQEHAYMVSDWQPWVLDGWPELITWFSALPFINLRNVKLNLQVRTVDGHVDFTTPSREPTLWQNNHDNEPCGYRMIVQGSRAGSLWVQRSDGTRVYPSMPDATDTYVLNHTAGLHGVDDETSRYTIFCHAEIDHARHAALLSRSLEKYADFAIWDK